jgi:hypothetical protein
MKQSATSPDGGGSCTIAYTINCPRRQQQVFTLPFGNLDGFEERAVIVDPKGPEMLIVITVGPIAFEASIKHDLDRQIRGRYYLDKRNPSSVPYTELLEMAATLAKSSMICNFGIDPGKKELRAIAPAPAPIPPKQT